jgi:hypothetical protein
MTFFVALMIIFAFHAKNSAFSIFFPKKEKEQHHSSFSPPLEEGYVHLYPHPIPPGKGVRQKDRIT